MYQFKFRQQNDQYLTILEQFKNGFITEAKMHKKMEAAAEKKMKQLVTKKQLKRRAAQNDLIIEIKGE